MTTERVEIQVGSDKMVMEWDGAQAGSPITVDGECTPYQTADARHRVGDAVRLVCGYLYGPVYDTARDARRAGRSVGVDNIVIWDDVSYETLGGEVE